MKLLLIVSALAVLSFAAAAPSACDPALVAKFEDQWEGKHDTEFLPLLNKVVNIYIVKTTKGLLPDNVKCYTTVYYEDNTAQNFNILTNGTQTSSVVYKVQNLDRQLYTPEPLRRRYYLPYSAKDGVAAFFTCEDNGTGTSPYISIVVFKKDYNKKKVSEAKKLFRSWGIKVNKSYPDTCDVKI